MQKLLAGISPGLALFVVSIYAPFTIGAILSPLSGDPAQYYVFATLVSMCIGTLLSTWMTGTALILAPAIGMTLILDDVVSSGVLSYRQALYASFVAGLLSLVVSWLRGKTSGWSWRFSILWNIPDEIKLGIRGGVGALLATQAWDNIQEITRPGMALATSRQGLLFWTAVATIFLFACDLRMRYLLALQSHGPPLQRFRAQRWLLQSGTFVAGLGMALFAFRQLPKFDLGAPSQSVPAMFGRSIITTLPAIFCAPVPDFFPALGVVVLLLFILLTDIPGTPYEMIEAPKTADEADQMQSLETPAIWRSFVADAVMAMANPFVRLAPSIYYAENLVLRSGHDDSIPTRMPAIICASLYAVAAGCIALADIPVLAFKNISLVAVSPILFYIGIRVVASSMLSEQERHDRSSHVTQVLAESAPFRPKARVLTRPDAFYYLPAATAVILTPIEAISFHLAIPISVLVYAACNLIRKPTPAEPRDLGNAPENIAEVMTLRLLVGSSVFAIVIWLGILLYHLDNPQAKTDSCALPKLERTVVFPLR